MDAPARTDVEGRVVRQLLDDQFPEFAGHALAARPLGGTDNAVFRLGVDFAVRVPRVVWAAAQLSKECTWLVRLAPLLPLAIPEPVALGRPGSGYPWSWAIYRWLPGEASPRHRVADEVNDAASMARFVAALGAIDLSGGPEAGLANGFRGAPLVNRDSHTRAAIKAKDHLVNSTKLLEAWDCALAADEWSERPRWLHGDLHPGNLLARNGRTTAVIDWGALAVGDPACDLMVAWNFPEGQREEFRKIVDLDDATWHRGRGWALTQWISGLHHEQPDNEARRVIDRILGDRS